MSRQRPSDAPDLTEWVPVNDEMPERETVLVPMMEHDPEAVDGFDRRAAEVLAGACVGDE